MLQDHNDIVEQLKAQVANAQRRTDRSRLMPWFDRVPAVMPVASSEQIAAVEAELGFDIPPLLKTIYREIGNGGRDLGPGLLGLPGGYDDANGYNILKSSRGMASFLSWWEQFIVICDQGCSMYSCIDCTDEDFGVYRWDGNAFDDPVHVDEPSEELWSLEANTFDDWIVDELHRYGYQRAGAVKSTAAEQQLPARPWWRFW
jgi:hypothetical protein